ncbi:MAG: hypothetical protein OEZ01_15005 [Candidatus Heimdallarchaeota archaeon]|nr:hypothetical protein [Candidatus Heimdallarchaeota archaeon]MDH5647316.1 hypothetical protein [Candidatus Heimdallarchaeota archaeon]
MSSNADLPLQKFEKDQYDLLTESNFNNQDDQLDRTVIVNANLFSSTGLNRILKIIQTFKLSYKTTRPGELSITLPEKQIRREIIFELLKIHEEWP